MLFRSVDPSDEISVVHEMLNQAEAIAEAPVNRLLLDGNYCNATILNEALSRDIDLLCPEHSETPKVRKRQVKA